jgi:uncharacterized protein (DUF488 family)
MRRAYDHPVKSRFREQNVITMNIFTIGYEGLDIEHFLDLLVSRDIETVVDVRELPLSRKKGFSKKSFHSILNTSGIEYVHMSDLGCPREVRDQYRENNNWEQYTKAFLKYLKTQSEAIAELSKLAESSNCVLVCYEADYNYCHRSLVAKAVQEHSGAVVQHIPLKK